MNGYKWMFSYKYDYNYIRFHTNTFTMTYVHTNGCDVFIICFHTNGCFYNMFSYKWMSCVNKSYLNKTAISIESPTHIPYVLRRIMENQPMNLIMSIQQYAT
jgi:hypothetical protein